MLWGKHFEYKHLQIFQLFAMSSLEVIRYSTYKYSLTCALKMIIFQLIQTYPNKEFQ